MIDMSEDEASKARAEHLREEIRRLKTKDSKQCEDSSNESPRDFIDRRMKEIREKAEEENSQSDDD